MKFGDPVEVRLRRFQIVQIKGQVLFKREIITKMGWGNLKLFSRKLSNMM
jgi:hypothetical protein